MHRWLVRCKGDCWGERVDTWCSDLAAGIPPVHLRAPRAVTHLESRQGQRPSIVHGACGCTHVVGQVEIVSKMKAVNAFVLKK